MNAAKNAGALRVLAASVLLLAFVAGADAKTDTTQKPGEAVPGVADIACTDFLAQLRKKPPKLEFVSCEKIRQYGTPALVARYRMAGADAAAIEAYFVKSAHMPPLRFLCCGWESIPKSPKAQTRTGFYVWRGQRFEITMSSDESTASQRKRWAEIPHFQVRATMYTESP